MTVDELIKELQALSSKGFGEQKIFVRDDGMWYDASETKRTSVYLGYGISEEGVVIT